MHLVEGCHAHPWLVYAKRGYWAPNPFSTCRYTFNSSSNLLNSTFYNLKERQGFIIRPFYIPVAAAAVKYSYEKDGYLIEPAVDLNTNEPYLSVQKNKDNYRLKGSYAFKEQYALLEVGYAKEAPDFNAISERSLVKVSLIYPL